MSVRTGEAIRENSRTLGLIFQTLSVLTLLGTIYATMKVSTLGSQLGIGAVHDPLAWFIFLGGMFAALILTGVGHAFALLCALFDRQQCSPKPLALEATRATPPSTVRQPPSQSRSPVWEVVVEKDADEIVAPNLAPPVVKPVTLPPVKEAPAPRGGLWAWLTRERYFTSKGRNRLRGSG